MMIMLTCLCNLDPLKLHFYKVKTGFTRVYIIFLIFALNHRFWVFIRTALVRRHSESAQTIYAARMLNCLRCSFTNKQIFHDVAKLCRVP